MSVSNVLRRVVEDLPVALRRLDFQVPVDQGVPSAFDGSDRARGGRGVDFLGSFIGRDPKYGIPVSGVTRFPVEKDPLPPGPYLGPDKVGQVGIESHNERPCKMFSLDVHSLTPPKGHSVGRRRSHFTPSITCENVLGCLSFRYRERPSLRHVCGTNGPVHCRGVRMGTEGAAKNV